MIEIEKNIPIPPTRRFTEIPWNELNIGDSFQVKKHHSGYPTMAARFGIKITIRKNKDGARIWRIA